MMNKGWYDEMWNPITGTPRADVSPQIKNHCKRFSGDIRMNRGMINVYTEVKPGYYELNFPVSSQGSDKHFVIAPFGTAPTFHCYRMDTPVSKYITGRNLYVNAYADTFDMPESWINKVIVAINRNQQHNFILISDAFYAMQKYLERFSPILCDNLWLGYKITERTAERMDRIEIRDWDCHFFLDVDEVTNNTVSMLDAYVSAPGSDANRIEWILVNVEKNTSEKNLTRIADIAEALGIPVFFDADGADLPRVLPKAFQRHTLSNKKKAMLWAKCARCKAENRKNQMYSIGWTKGRGCSVTKLGFLCEDCFAEYQRHFPFF